LSAEGKAAKVSKEGGTHPTQQAARTSSADPSCPLQCVKIKKKQSKDTQFSFRKYKTLLKK
jgi:hypothetical protein